MLQFRQELGVGDSPAAPGGVHDKNRDHRAAPFALVALEVDADLPELRRTLHALRGLARLCSAGISIAISSAMMPMTTSSSTRVKPFLAM